MNLRWRVVVIDDISNPGVLRLQDVVALDLYDALQSRFNPSFAGKNTASRLALSLPIDQPDFFIKESMEVWAGVWDDDSEQWLAAIFCGFIAVQEGDVTAGEHTFDCELDDWSTLPNRVLVDGFPEPPLPGGMHGIPYDLSVWDWLLGPIQLTDGRIVPGLLPMFLDDAEADLSGIDELFQFVHIGIESPVGINNDENNFGLTGETNNFFAYTDLKACLDALVNVVYTISGGSIRPVYFFSPVVDGDRIRPKFYFMDLAAPPPAPVCTIASDADPSIGEIQIAKPFKHRRDFRPVLHDVFVKGVFADGSVIPEGADPAESAPLVQWREWREDHAREYSVPRYIRNKRWGAAPQFVPQISTIAHARRMAERMEQQVWGARGNITCSIELEDIFEALGDDINPFDLFKVGNWISFRDTNESIGVLAPQFYPLNDVQVDLSGNGPMFTIALGLPQLELSDVIKGGTMEIPLLLGDTVRGAAGRVYQRQYDQAWPQGAVPSQTPVHSTENVTIPRYANVVAQTFVQQTRPRPAGDVSGLTPEPPSNAYLQHLTRQEDGSLVKRDWINQDQSGHPHHLPFDFATDGTVRETIFDPIDLHRMIVHGSGCVLIERETAPDVWEVLSIPEFYRVNPDGGVVYRWPDGEPFADESRMRVTATSISGPLSIGLSERIPLGDPLGEEPDYIAWGICSGPPGGS